MIYIIILTLIVITCIYRVSQDYYNDDFSLFIGLFSSIALIIMIVAIPLNRSEVHNKLAQRNAIQNTYNNLRKNSNSYEMATVGKNIADWNAWLASAQYWHTTQWKLYWPEEVMITKPIE